MREILLATCREVPLDSPGDRLLDGALRRVGIVGRGAVWGEEDPAGRPVVIRSCWDYHRHSARFRRWLDGLRVPVLNPPELVRWNLDKRYLTGLAAAGLPTIPTTFVAQNAPFDLGRECAAKGRVVVKPTVSASADGAWTSVGGDQARFDREVAERALMVQPYLQEIEEEGEVSVVAFDGHPTHAVRKRPAPGGWRVQEEHGGASSPEPLDASLASFAGAALAALPALPCYARIDAVRVGGRWRLMELELIEPHLYLSLGPTSADAFAEAIRRRLA